MDCEDSSSLLPQKKIIYNTLLPEYNQASFDNETQQLWKTIKDNLFKAALNGDIKNGCCYYANKVIIFISLYGYYFSKEDHIAVIQLLYELICIPEQSIGIGDSIAGVLTVLLKKHELLSPDDLVLQWQPLYLTCKKSYKLYGDSNIINLQMLVEYCKPYFPLTATKEILEEWRPQFCFTMESSRVTLMWLKVFLPYTIHPKHSDKGYKLWLDEFYGIWEALSFTGDECLFFKIFARLAFNKIGYIDWESKLPFIFTVILRSFKLPVSYQKSDGAKIKTVDIHHAALFIVANLGGDSKTQEHLDRLLIVLESYFHPFNKGRWTKRLHNFLVDLTRLFVHRLNWECHMKLKSHQIPVHESKKLTEDDITDFVKSVLKPAQLAMYSTFGYSAMRKVYHDLSNLRPEIVIPSLLTKLVSSLNTVVEPHRLMAGLHCMGSSIRPLVEGKRYPEGPLHVVSLLFSVLPGIDPNDIPKCLATLYFLRNFVSLVPLVDCSNDVEERTDLTEIEKEVCLQTTAFEDFVMQFMDKCFRLIECLSLDQVTQLDVETDALNKDEISIRTLLNSSFYVVLLQSHPVIAKAAIQKLLYYIKGRIMEIRVAGKLIASMCAAATQACPDIALELLLPGICKFLIRLLSNEDLQKQEHLDTDVLFNLLLLSRLVICRASTISKYISDIVQVLEISLHFKCQKGHELATLILGKLIVALSFPTATEINFHSNDSGECRNEDIYIRKWGEMGSARNITLQWNVPHKTEEEGVLLIVHKFLVPELIKLRKFTSEEKHMSREALHQCLAIVECIMRGGIAFPCIAGEPINVLQASVSSYRPSVNICCLPLNIEISCDSFPKNVRMAVAEVILKLLEHLLSSGSDDIKLLDDCYSTLKEYHTMKGDLHNSVVKNKKQTKFLLMLRTMGQYYKHLCAFNEGEFNATQKEILFCLFKVSTSQYSEVRKLAQSVLLSMFRNFQNCHRLLIEEIAIVLKKNPENSHKEIKGCLYLLEEYTKMLCDSSFKTLTTLWPSLISMKHSEKLSMVKRLRIISLNLWSRSQPYVLDKVNDRVISIVQRYYTDASINMMSCAHSDPNYNIQEYMKLVNNLSCLLKDEDLHWRHKSLALCMLKLLTNYDIPPLATAVQVILENLVNDNLFIRRASFEGILCVMDVLKKMPEKSEVNPVTFFCGEEKTGSICPGDDRPDNLWLQYTKDISENETYVDKLWCGWYDWPKCVYVCCSDKFPKQRQREDFSDAEKEIYDFFISKENMDKLLTLLSNQKQSKAKDFFMYLGKIFGDAFISLYEPHLEKFASSTYENNQRFATDMIAGIVKGCKYWHKEEIDKLFIYLLPVVRKFIQSINAEVFADGRACINYIGNGRDPKRLRSLIEMMMNDPLNEVDSTMVSSSQFNFLAALLNRFAWRVAEPWNRLLEYLKSYLHHPYHSIRKSIGLALSCAFRYDISFSGKLVLTKYPKCAEFVEYLLPMLSCLICDSSFGGISCYPVPLERSICKPERFMSSDYSEICTSSTEIDFIDFVKNSDFGDAICNASNVSFDNFLSDSNKEFSKTQEAAQSLERENYDISSGSFQAHISEEKKEALLLMQVVCHWLCYQLKRPVYRFLPHLCHLESINSDMELRTSCQEALSLLSKIILLEEELEIVLDLISHILSSGWWRARVAALSFTQVFVFYNMFTVLNNAVLTNRIIDFILNLLCDPRVEVRKSASEVLSGLTHCSFVRVDDKFVKLKQLTNKELIEKHAGALGLCACISAFPYNIPKILPGIIMIVSEHMNDPQPISSTIRETLSNFKRTHTDSWREHKEMFTGEQLNVLTDLLLSPSYYA